MLRRGLNPKEASKAFVLDMADNRTIDLVHPPSQYISRVCLVVFLVGKRLPLRTQKPQNMFMASEGIAAIFFVTFTLSQS